MASNLNIAAGGRRSFCCRRVGMRCPLAGCASASGKGDRSWCGGLFLCGLRGSDPYGTLAQIQEIETRIYAPLETCILPGCGHAPQLEQKSVNLNHLTLPEFRDFNALSDALCCKLNGFRSRAAVQDRRRNLGILRASVAFGTCGRFSDSVSNWHYNANIWRKF